MVWGLLDSGFNEKLKKQMRKDLKEKLRLKILQSQNKSNRRRSTKTETISNLNNEIKLIVVDGDVSNEEVLMIQQFKSHQIGTSLNMIDNERLLVSSHNVFNLSPTCISKSSLIFMDNNKFGNEY